MKAQKHIFIPFLLSVGCSQFSVGQGFIASSLERYNYQIGDGALALRSYDGFDDIDGFDHVTGLTLSINGGSAENIPYSTFYEAYKRANNYATLGEMLAARPIDATYTHTLSGTPSGSVTITAPGVSYANAIPVNPLFTINGVNGTWVTRSNGVGRFYFNPNSVSSFTITMNAYSVNTQGGHYVYSTSVHEFTDSTFDYVDALESDIVENGGVSPVPANLVLTFNASIDSDGGDDDPATYGFTAGSMFELEGEHVNVFGLSDAGLGSGVADKAFIFETVTAFELVAVTNTVPEDLPIATQIEITSHGRDADKFTMSWQTTPAGAPVDIYRSEDLVTWGSPISTINFDGAFAENIAPGSRGFYVVVAAGGSYPPTP